MNQGKIVTVMIYNYLWGTDKFIDEQVTFVKVNMTRLRKRLENIGPLM